MYIGSSGSNDVLGEVSPEFELPIEQRYMANVYGKVLSHSGTLREGKPDGHARRSRKNAEGASFVDALAERQRLAYSHWEPG